MSKKYIYALGRRKTATAQVRLYEWKGDSTINGKDIQTYLKREDLFNILYKPLRILKKKNDFYFSVIVSGSGQSTQAQAIAHGISRALCEINETVRPVLKQEGLLTRDARKVERKKPGRHKARKSVQWSKR